jgi:LDH2 family malate/lactate/ureidoglycolate dehydrogenase
MKGNGTNRVLIPGNCQDNKAIAMAMKLGIELSRKVADQIEGVALYLPNKKSILNSSLEKVVSAKIARLLHNGRQVPMGKGVELRAETTRTFKNGSHKDIVIAINADSKMMAKVDAMEGLHTVIAVPRKEGALDSWAETWSALIPGAKKKKVEKQVIIDPVIADALSALAVGIDPSVHGLATQDRKQVENMIRLLRQNNHQEKPANIRAWAVRHGWHPETADELVRVWEEVYCLNSTSTANFSRGFQE